MFPYAISGTSGKYVSVLANPYDYLQLLVPNSDNPDTQHTIISENSCHDREKRGYCSRFHDVIIYYNKMRLYWSMSSINNRVYYFNLHVITGSCLRNLFVEHLHCIALCSVDWWIFFPSLHYFNCWTCFCACFIFALLIPHCSNYSVWYNWIFHLVLLLF